jgi:hypothetical protein
MNVIDSLGLGRAELGAAFAALPDEEQRNQLIARHVRPGARSGGRHCARVQTDAHGALVWALIGNLRGGGGTRQTALEYDLPEEAVIAVVAFYERHRPYIDAFLLLNEDYFDDWEEPEVSNGRGE